jgi:hypothetical protein
MVADMVQVRRVWPKTRSEIYNAYRTWEDWAQAHDPPFHLRDVLRDLISAARDRDTLTYGYFRQKYGLARGSIRSKKDQVGSGVGWVVGLVARIFALQHRTNIELSSIVVTKATKIEGNPGYPGEGFNYHRRTSEGRREEARRAQKEAWNFFSRVSRHRFRNMRQGAAPGPLDGKDDDAAANELLIQLRRRRSPPDRWGKSRLRIGQDQFRRVVLENFNHRCAVCGVDVDKLLEAAHLRAWSHSKAERLDPANGVALCSLHHTAQERNLLTITDRGRIVMAPEVMVSSNPIVQWFLAKYHQARVLQPKWPVRYA